MRVVGTAEGVDVVADFERERPRLLGLAYRILGTMSDAEDVVQDVWLRWERTDREVIQRPAAWLTTVTSRAALDRLKARQRRREDYVGPWLPEPIELAEGPEQSVELADSLTLGFLVLLERLDPTERVVFLLADVFGEPYATIAEVVGRSPEACRKMASRARRRVQDERRGSPQRQPDRAVVVELAHALMTGDMAKTLSLLDADVVLTSDGGRDHRAARHPVVTAPRVGRLLINLAKRVPEGVPIRQAVLNGDPAVVVGRPTAPALAVVFETAGGRVFAIRIVVNPEKLGHLGNRAELR